MSSHKKFLLPSKSVINSLHVNACSCLMTHWLNRVIYRENKISKRYALYKQQEIPISVWGFHFYYKVGGLIFVNPAYWTATVSFTPVISLFLRHRKTLIKFFLVLLYSRCSAMTVTDSRPIKAPLYKTLDCSWSCAAIHHWQVINQCMGSKQV